MGARRVLPDPLHMGEVFTVAVSSIGRVATGLGGRQL